MEVPTWLVKYSKEYKLLKTPLGPELQGVQGEASA